MNILKWLLMALAIFSPTLHAADWVKVSSGNDPNQFFYDRSKLHINKDEITYWKRIQFAAPQTVRDQQALSGLFRERINCAEHTLKLISYVYYSPDGATIEYVGNNEADAAPIIPDTVGDVFEKTLCVSVAQKKDAGKPDELEQAQTITPSKPIVVNKQAVPTNKEQDTVIINVNPNPNADAINDNATGSTMVIPTP